MERKSPGLAAAVILVSAAAGICAGREFSEFAGTWVMYYQGQPVFKLTLSAAGSRLTGSLTKPRDLIIDSDGDVTATGPDQVTQTVRRAKLKNEQLELIIEGDTFFVSLKGPNQASFVTLGIRPLTLERIADGAAVTLAASLVERDYPKEIRQLRERLRAMAMEDQDARLNFAEARIEATDLKNRPEVLAVFDRYGWVTNSLAGKEAAYHFWLLVQHQGLETWQRLLPALEKAAKSGDASMWHYAYLYDRLQLGLGKPQHWGTQTECKKGKPVLREVDDPAGLDARRRELFLPPIRDYLKMEHLVKLCSQSR